MLVFYQVRQPVYAIDYSKTKVERRPAIELKYRTLSQLLLYLSVLLPEGVDGTLIRHI